MQSAFMNHGLIAAGLLASCVIALPPASHAQQTASAEQARAHLQPSTDAGIDIRASEIIGKQVNNAQGENLGDVEDLVIDIDNQRVHYVLMSFGGALGLGEKQFALPAERLRPGARERDPLVLNVSKEELKKAPGFDPGKRPNFSEETYRGEVDRYFFKEESVRHTPAKARLVSADELIGKDVNDRGAHDAGEIEDLVINFGSGRTYAVMEVDKSWSPKDKLVALPLTALSFPQRPDLDLLLNIDRPLIENARGLEKNIWSDINAAETKKRINEDLMRLQAQVKTNPGATQTGRETSSGASR